MVAFDLYLVVYMLGIQLTARVLNYIISVLLYVFNCVRLYVSYKLETYYCVMILFHYLRFQ